MKNFNLFAFSGYQNSGKDTAVNMFNFILTTKGNFSYLSYCKSRIPVEYTVVAFASRLKLAASILSGEPLSLFEDRNTKELPLLNIPSKSKRELVSFLGESIRLDFAKNPTYLAELTLGNITEKDKIIVSDLRSLAEESVVKKYGGITINIVRGTTAYFNNGQSEVHLLKSDYTIKNNSTKQDLYYSLLNLYLKIYE